MAAANRARQRAGSCWPVSLLLVLSAVPAGGLLASPAAGAASRAAASRAAASPRVEAAAACVEPAFGGGELTQSLDGQVSGCWLVAPQSPGVDVVALQAFASAGTSGAPLGQQVTLRLAPATGHPGQRITVSGELAHAVAASAAESEAEVCFDTCAGLTETVPVTWTHRAGSATVRDFTASALAPAAPFFVDGSPHGLLSGSYPVGIACAGVLVGGCASAGAQGIAAFGLEVSHPIRCSRAAPCASLHLSPSHADPGTTVRVTGFAPITTIYGSSAFGPSLSVSPPSGGPSPGGPSDVVVARARITVGTGTTWASLSSTRPIAVQLAGPSPGPLSIVGGPPGLPAPGSGTTGSGTTAPGTTAPGTTAPGTLAHCVPGAIELVSGATGAVVTSVPTTAVARAGLGGLALVPAPSRSEPPTCVAVLADPARSGTYFATFDVVLERYGAPPLYEVGLSTTDSGASWHVVTPPPGAAAGSFSGFRLAASGAVEAVFSATPPVSGPPESMLVEDAPAGTARFRAARPSCPGVGPCLVIGPYGWANCAMISSPQQLLVQRAGRFVPAGSGGPWPGPLDACAPAEVAATGRASALVVDSASVFPLELTTDGGRTFRSVSLPPLTLPGGGAPLGRAGASYPPGSGGLVLLPDGALLATTGEEPSRSAVAPSQRWHLLEPHATRWCMLAPLAPSGPTPPLRQPSTAAVGPVEALAGSLWWQLSVNEPPAGTPAALSLEHAPLSRLTCQAGT